MSGGFAAYRVRHTVNKGARRMHLAEDPSDQLVLALEEPVPPGAGPHAAELSFDHPNLARVRTILAEPGAPVRQVIFDFPLGRTLADDLAAGTLPPDLAAELVRQLAVAVAFLHDRKTPFILGTMSPAQVVVQGGMAVLDVTGLSALIRSPSGSLLQYAAPEVLLGEPCPQSDVYCLGTMLLHLLTGKALRSGAAWVPGAAVDWFPDTEEKPGGGLPEELLAILEKALHPAPSERLASAGALHRELDHFLRTFQPGRQSTIPLVEPGGQATAWLPDEPAAVSQPAVEDPAPSDPPARSRSLLVPVAIGMAAVLALAIGAFAAGRLLGPGGAQARQPGPPPVGNPAPETPIQPGLSEPGPNPEPNQPAEVPPTAPEPTPESAPDPAMEPTPEPTPGPAPGPGPQPAQPAPARHADPAPPKPAYRAHIEGPDAIIAGTRVPYTLVVTDQNGRTVRPPSVLWLTAGDPFAGHVLDGGRVEGTRPGEVTIAAIVRDWDLRVERTITVVPSG